MNARKGFAGPDFPQAAAIALLIFALVVLILPSKKPQEEAVASTQDEASKATAVHTEKPSEVVQRESYRIEYYLEQGTARIIVFQTQNDKTGANLGYGCSEEILQGLFEIRKKYFTSDPLPISTHSNGSSVTRVVIVSIAPKIGIE